MPNTSLAKCDPAQLNQTVKWILSGATVFDITEAIGQNFPETDANALIMEAMRHFEKNATFDVDVVRGWCFEATRDLYRRMVEANDLKGALGAVKQILEMTKNVHRREPDEAGTEAETGPATTDAEDIGCG